MNIWLLILGIAIFLVLLIVGALFFMRGAQSGDPFSGIDEEVASADARMPGDDTTDAPPPDDFIA